MNNSRGFAMGIVLVVVLGLMALGGAGYVAMNPEVLQAPADEAMSTDASIAWRFTDAGEIDAMPYTNVAVVVNGKTYEMGKFLGSCSEVGASGGVDGKGLLTGELSAAQCWFAGGGQEIGVFGHEEGGVEIMVGQLDEGNAETSGFRGDFVIKHSVLF